jgi:hypothetical protein
VSPEQFPQPEVPFLNAGDVVVSDSIEYPVGSFGLYSSTPQIDISDTQIVITDTGTGGFHFDPAAFNGWILHLVSGPGIASAAADPTSTFLPFAITMVGGDLKLNYQDQVTAPRCIVDHQLLHRPCAGAGTCFGCGTRAGPVRAGSGPPSTGRLTPVAGPWGRIYTNPADRDRSASRSGQGCCGIRDIAVGLSCEHSMWKTAWAPRRPPLAPRPVMIGPLERRDGAPGDPRHAGHADAAHRIPHEDEWCLICLKAVHDRTA